MYGLHPTHLSVMFNLVLEHVHSNLEHLISDLDQPWLEEGQVSHYARVTQNAGLLISNCWGFIDGTVMPICRPSQNQREVYNCHRHIHALKYQSAVLPNGLIAWAHGRKTARRHTSCGEWAPRRDPFPLCHKQTSLPVCRAHHIRAVLEGGHQASVSRGLPISLELSAVECEC